jgi:hypothetical protein
MITSMIKGRDNEMSPACRDEGQIILTKCRFVNRGVRLYPQMIALAQWSIGAKLKRQSAVDSSIRRAMMRALKVL